MFLQAETLLWGIAISAVPNAGWKRNGYSGASKWKSLMENISSHDANLSREGLISEIRVLRRLVASGVRNKKIPWPSKADPDAVFAAARALAENPETNT